MSLDFDHAPVCKGPRCTHLLTASSDYKRGYCEDCAFELQEKQDKEAEERKIEKSREK